MISSKLRTLCTLRTASLLLLAAAGAAQAQNVYLNGTVGASIAPGVYGQITFGNNPPPPVLYAQPVIIQRAPVQQPPLYLYVPPGHAKNWAKHCSHYNACGRPVYFVQVNTQNRWWDGERGGQRPPQMQQGRPDGFDHGPGRRDHDDDHGHGRGRGHGEGHRKFDDNR
jgi:hypothetical protein